MQFAIIIVLLIASAAITAMTSKQPKPTASVLADFNTPQSAEGTPQTVVFGDVWIQGWQVLWFGNLQTQPIYATGGKK